MGFQEPDEAACEVGAAAKSRNQMATAMAGWRIWLRALMLAGTDLFEWNSFEAEFPRGRIRRQREVCRG
mgnify:CR=1 FL=1